VRHIVGVSDMRISNVRGDQIITHALGSCLGIAVHDATMQIGGLVHVMLPTSTLNPDKARANPCMFVDTGIPALVQQMLANGAAKNRLTVKVAGGAAIQGNNGDRFGIGRRNCVMLRKTLWQHGLLLDAEDVGGETPRTMCLEIGTGRVWLSWAGQEKEL
jgi:chemotaxis protein CheD